ncbi:hypothetical protein K431DRAFT_320709 [Polychaeton citri CBS 116435]|uniref:Peptidase S33 tripeptidyl aminopeptidase-like C-terminal domain-containing protein n=1 Tax=Polychaeton citri CBS 116435 TaxID=1314669 RepID=A0A9P4Q5P1_9PEZI|nr:hypothetical protein K431DRAFT_320709 [Polychaeton citri CBS 116435]
MSAASLQVDIPFFDWSTIQPSASLDFSECYSGFHCARLHLPLDWHNSSNQNNVSLAVIRRPADVAPDHESYGGAVVLNPGGPGGSGVLMALNVADRMQRLINVNGSKQYDVVSFDPRGVFQTTPGAFCFDTSIESESWWRTKRAVGNLNDGGFVLSYHWAAETARGEACASSSEGSFPNGDNVRQYMSTASVARDMLELAAQLSTEHALKHHVSQASDLATQQVLRPAEASSVKLIFMGASYGTFLGQTFASMFPENIGKMVLDANLDAENWVSRYEGSISDNRAGKLYFFQRCFVGKSKCAFWRSEDSAPVDIENRYIKVVENLRGSPVVAYSTTLSPAVLTSSDLEWGFFMTTYQPLVFAPSFARILDAIENGREPTGIFWHHQFPAPAETNPQYSDYVLHNGEITSAIHCSDGPDLTDTNMTDFKDFLNHTNGRFGLEAGAVQAEFKLSCWTWPSSLRTKWRYAGPFGSNKSAPILFVNNRIDGATPLKSARKMAKLFAGSAVLEQDAVAHGALWPGGRASECAWGHVREYLNKGSLPADNEICKFECEAFGECNETTMTSDQVVPSVYSR